MALVPDVVAAPAGGTAVGAGVATGDTFNPSDAADLVATNTSGASVNVTLVAKSPCNQGVIHNLVVAIPAGATKVVGPLSPGRFADPITGLGTINVSAANAITAYVLRS